MNLREEMQCSQYTKAIFKRCRKYGCIRKLSWMLSPQSVNEVLHWCLGCIPTFVVTWNDTTFTTSYHSTAFIAVFSPKYITISGCILFYFTFTYSEINIFVSINDWQASSHIFYCSGWCLWNKILQVFWIRECLSVLFKNACCGELWNPLQTRTRHRQAVIWY